VPAAKRLRAAWKERGGRVVIRPRTISESLPGLSGKFQTCDERIDGQLRSMKPKIDPLSEPIPQPRRGKDARGHWVLAFACSCTASRGWTLRKSTALKCRMRKPSSEVGVGMSRWKTEKHFTSWLGLCPDNRSSGGKVLKRGTRARSQSCLYRVTADGLAVAPKPKRFGSKSPPAAFQTRGAQSHHRDGTRAGRPGL
jgi:Transposase IS116/IS110/IS902 family